MDVRSWSGRVGGCSQTTRQSGGDLVDFSDVDHTPRVITAVDGGRPALAQGALGRF
jgi:hypothetical protein